MSLQGLEILVVLGGGLILWAIRQSRRQQTDLTGFRETIRELRARQRPLA